jgi:hypothetical protein
MILRIVVVCIVGLACCEVARGADEPEHGEQEVFRKPLDGDREIVVVRGTGVAPQMLKDVAPQLTLDQSTRVYVVRVELRAQDHLPVVLGSRAVSESEQDYTKGFDVFDMLSEPDGITLATAERGTIVLWHIGLFMPQPSRWTILRHRDWSMSAAAYRLHRNIVSVRLGRSAEGKLTVEVVERRPGQHTAFEQVEDKWEFKPVKQWQGKAPAGARPAEQ